MTHACVWHMMAVSEMMALDFLCLSVCLSIHQWPSNYSIEHKNMTDRQVWVSSPTVANDSDILSNVILN